MLPSPLDSAVRWASARRKWIAGAVVGALLVWVASCALCGDSGEPAHPPPATYQAELQAIDSELRSDLTDADYDRYLYASGRSNRAGIAAVIGSSPGESARFRPGETLVRYGGKRVFSVEELLELPTRRDP